MKPEQVKKMREKREWSQFDLSDKSGISRFNISMIENGRRPISATEKRDLERAFKGAK